MAWIVFLGSWKKKRICYVVLKSGEEIWRRGFTQMDHKLWILIRLCTFIFTVLITKLSKFGVIKVFLYKLIILFNLIKLNKLQ